MKTLRQHIQEIADTIPPERAADRAAVLAFGADVERIIHTIRGEIGTLKENQRQLRERLDPLIYERIELFMERYALQVAEYYARLAGQADAAAADRAELRQMILAIAADLRTLRAEVERCCGPGGPLSRAVGETEGAP